MKTKYRLFNAFILSISVFSLFGQVRDTSFIDLSRAFKMDHINPVNPSSYNAFKAKTFNLPLFCRIEHCSDLVSPLQVRFRLGSLDYVNMLESK